eukprot:817554-Amphidinium_carterae.1
MAHNNLGHPKQADFTRLLRRGGARDASRCTTSSQTESRAGLPWCGDFATSPAGDHDSTAVDPLA